MLQIVVAGTELYDEVTETFSTVNDVTLELEHSLISLSKWEAKTNKPFLGPGGKTPEDVISYIQAMILTPNPPANITDRLSDANIKEIQAYIDSQQSATTFNDRPNSAKRSEIITAELIYYWMIGFVIPFECQYWHLNRLFALIRVCNVKNTPGKMMPKHEIAQRNRELNAQRRAELGTRG